MKAVFTRRRECRCLTIWGWAVVFALGAALAVGVLLNIHSFLAITTRVPAEILVVEGWLPDFALKEAVEEFNENGYQWVVTTGTKIPQGRYFIPFENTAELGAATLKKMGVPEDRIFAVPSAYTRTDRTYNTAVAFRQWFLHSPIYRKSFDVVTLGPHARRTRLLYAKAFGNDYKIGVIAARDLNYHHRRWFKSSQGVRTVISETIAYLYARLVFSP